jgi:hypothetical protein
VGLEGCLEIVQKVSFRFVGTVGRPAARRYSQDSDGGHTLPADTPAPVAMPAPALPADSAPSASAAAAASSEDAVALVPPPPLPPPDDARLPKPRFGNPSWEVPGGYIVFNVAASSLDAHCDCRRHFVPGNPCRANRKALEKPGAKSPHTLAQGRPLGFLLRWLAIGMARPLQENHHNSSVRKLRTEQDVDDLSYDKRCEARVWAKGQPALAGLFKLERKPRAGETEEPPEIP